MNLTTQLKQHLWGSPRTSFVVYPLISLATETLLQRRIPPVRKRFLPLLVWGYAEYRLCRIYRASQGAGNSSMALPPDRLVTTGPYAITRNPMYLGHIIYSFGVALALKSPIATLLAAARCYYFSKQVEKDERRLSTIFGEEYGDYQRKVKRWGLM